MAGGRVVDMATGVVIGSLLPLLVSTLTCEEYTHDSITNGISTIGILKKVHSQFLTVH